MPLSQNAQILAHLRSGEAITPYVALERWGCFRLSARILELRRAGHNIRSEALKLGQGKRVAMYSLAR